MKFVLLVMCLAICTTSGFAAEAPWVQQAYRLASEISDTTQRKDSTEWVERVAAIDASSLPERLMYARWLFLAAVREGEVQGYQQALARFQNLATEADDKIQLRFAFNTDRTKQLEFQQQFAQGVALCDELLQNPALTPDERIILITQRGIFHYFQRAVSQTLAEVTKATEIINQGEVSLDLQLHTAGLKNLVLMDLGDRQGWIETTRREYNLERLSGYPVNGATWLYNIQSILQEAGAYDKAQDVIDAYRIADQASNPTHQYFAEFACADLAQRMQDKERQRSCLLAAEPFVQALPDRIQDFYTFLADTHLGLGDLDAAAVSLAKARAQANKQGATVDRNDTYLDRMEIELVHRGGESAAAFEQLKLHLDAREEHHNDQLSRIAGELRELSTAEAETLLERNALLDSEAALHSLVIERQQQAVALFALMLVAVIGLAIKQRRTSQRLKQANADVTQASRAKSVFLATMSHEIRTPMNGVLGMSQLLMNTQLDTEQQGFVRTIHHSGNALLTVIDDVLDFSKIESGKLEIVPEPMSLGPLFNDVHALLKPNADKKGIALRLDISNTLPSAVHADSGRLRQVMLNLVGNAIKFTETGEVVIRVGGATLANQLTLECAVTDTGIGIAQENLDSVFEQFSQAESNTTRKFGGTGLGLSISGSLIESMGGRIQVKSKIGVGSTFSFAVTLPVASETVTQARNKALRNPSFTDNFAAPPTSRVLVVDDNAVNRTIAKKMLERLGCSVECATDGKDALSHLHRTNYDLVFMDISMPEMDGMEATRQWREIEQQQDRKGTPVIALTAHVMQGDEQRFRDAGLDDYLSKPLQQERLQNALSRWQKGPK